MDNADIAEDRIQNVRDGGIAIARERAAKIRALVPCNACYWCDAALNDGFVFCANQECMLDYHHEQQRRQDLGL